MKKPVLSVVLLLLFAHILVGQIPSNPIGSNPFVWSWHQINNDKIQVIFPEAIESLGLQVSQLALQIHDRQSPSIGDQKHKVTILLHPENVRSNGFVTVGPFRSEFFTVTPQYKSPLNWIDELTIHEYRHIEQFANSTRGITKTAKSIFGSWAWGGFMATALPRWYFEGDAVIAETSLTEGGRGRFPEFNMQYHTLIHEGIHYGYEKAGARSLKDYVPTWFPLGYNILSYGREKFGVGLWRDVVDDAVRYRGLTYAFSKSLDKRTGHRPADMYEAMLLDLADKWAGADADKNPKGTPINNMDKKTVQHYNAATQLPDESMVVIRSGFDRIFELALINKNGAESRLCDMGIMLESQLATLASHQYTVVWSELGFDHRWSNRSYSDIYIYDVLQRSKRRLTKRNRYFSPAFNPDGTKIVAVEVMENHEKRLVIIDSADGTVIGHTEPTYDELSYPIYLSDTKIAFVNTKNTQNAIFIYDLSTQQTTTLLAYTYDHIAHLKLSENYIYYAQSVNEVSQIVRVSIDDGNEQLMTESIIGAFQPAVSQDGSQLLYSEFSSQGYNLMYEDIKEARETKSKSQGIAPRLYYHNNRAQEERLVLTEIPDLPESEVTKFNRFSGLLNPHSILPQWTDPEVSLSLLSDNTFGTLSGRLSGAYNYNEDEFRYGASLRYAELYPIIDLSVFNINRNALFFDFTSQTDTSFTQQIYVNEWSERRLSAGVTLPYTFSRGQMSNLMLLSVQYQNVKTSVDDEFAPEILRSDTIAFPVNLTNQVEEIFSTPLGNDNLHVIQTRFILQLRKFQAIQNLNTRLGFTLDIRHRNNLSDAVLGGDNLLIRSDLFLPGLTRNHNFFITTAYMNESIASSYRFSDLFVYPRGYNFSLRRDNYFKIGFNYSFPIWYPDVPIGGLAFITRVKGNAFYDYARVETDTFPFNNGVDNLNSVGFELGFDIRALRLLEIDFGVRYSYLLNESFAPGGQRHQFDFFVISISE